MEENPYKNLDDKIYKFLYKDFKKSKLEVDETIRRIKAENKQSPILSWYRGEREAYKYCLGILLIAFKYKDKISEDGVLEEDGEN